MVKRLWSWLVGRRIGEVVYTEGLPFITGTIGCILPPECWTQRERGQIVLRYEKHEWTGYKWEHRGIVEVSMKGKK